jgi:uncharacterized protein (TIGR02996 family)
VPRFEYYDAEASFWDITLVGKTITTRWGRAASRGVAKVKHYADDDEARRDYDKQIKAKRKKGYKLVAGTEEPEAKRREAPAATSSMRNPELEAAVILNPNDDATLLVLGDWLQAQGDPRGELVALQHAQRDEKDPMKFLAKKKHVEAHYATHEAAILGPIYPYRHLMKLDWQLGYIRGARISMLARRPDDPDVSTVIEALSRVPAAVTIQELSLGSIGMRDPSSGRYVEAIAALVECEGLAALRTLHFGDYWPGERPEHGALGPFEPLGPRFPQLRRLVVAYGTPTYGTLALPELRNFDQRSLVDEAALVWLASHAWPKLEQFAIDVHGMAPNRYVALLSPQRFPSVKNVRLFDSTSTDALIAQLPAAPLLPRLEILDLDDGDLSDEGAATLIQNWGAFRHLKTLRLGKQHVTYNATLRLRELGIEVSNPNAYRAR